jgi:hypothetical protein
MKFRLKLVPPVLIVMFLAAIGHLTINTPLAVAETPSKVPAAGSQVDMRMQSTVGILLDEIPTGTLRRQAAETARQHDDAFWIAKAQRQIRLTDYRLVFRSGYYDRPKGPLPLPDRAVWNINLVGKARRQQVNGHDYVAINYTFRTILISDPDSPGAVEPALRRIGGTWAEPLILPIDPDLLFERTGYACMDEIEFPIGSVFEENTWYYYDQTCGVETAADASCHLTELPTESCVHALTKHVGKVSTHMHFKRIPYDAAKAATYRVGTLVNPNGADLAVVQIQMSEENAVFYRYFAPDSCEIVENTVGAPGWRRLLAFSASVRNDGTQPVHMGDPSDPNNPWVQSHAFVFSACHRHYHFTHYGTFKFGNQPGLKKAFCLEDTNRYHNDERTPLTAIHQTCLNQGIGAGWGDEYNFGISGQWVDVTDEDTSTVKPLTFLSNPDQFLCEGQTLNADGQAVDPLDLANVAFVPSGFFDDNGDAVKRNSCALPANWDADNLGSISFSAPAGSFVTQDCTRGQTGPIRDCGFAPAPPAVRSCTLGQTVQLVYNDPAPKVVRVCEMSAQLGVGVACAYRSALANEIVSGSGATVEFSCPVVRDGTAGTGGYSVYEAPVL